MVILEAPPGAGKSTFLPLQLLKQASRQQQKILLLEPRRLAARNVAAFLAQQLGEPLGQTVGLRMRQETKVSDKTRIEVVTEGVLTRLLQSDPELNGIGLVIFDEFHERSLHADLGLALSVDVQQGLRDDLKILVMSATLEGMALQERFPEAALVQCEGRSYPVEVFYQGRDRRQPLAPQMVKLTEQALLESDGSVLVFLPGMFEIQQLQRQLTERLAHHTTLDSSTIEVTPLYGSLDPKAQRQAIAPAADGKRKVVLATNVAETSLTIDGISVVVDSGLHRQASYHHKIGHTRLDTQEISQASATQRAGRAGRLMPGRAYRLWSEELHSRKAKQSLPEIQSADLSALVLELAMWGVTCPEDLTWLDLPDPSLWQSAVARLQQYQAIDGEGRITAHGQALAKVGASPEVAHMLVWAVSNATNQSALKPTELALPESSLLDTAAAVAVLMEEPLPKQPFADDLGRWLDWLTDTGEPHQAMRRRLQQRAQQLKRQTVSGAAASWKASLFNHDYAALLVAIAYPDWIAGVRGQQYLTARGFGANLAENSRHQNAEWLAVASLRDSHSGNPLVSLAAPLSLSLVEAHCDSLIEERQEIGWDARQERVTATEGRYLGKLPLTTKPLQIPVSDPRWQQGVLAGIAARGVDKLPWTPALRNWQQRVLMAQRYLTVDNWPDVSDQRLAADWQWLAPFITDVRHPNKLTETILRQALHSLLDWSLAQLLDKQLPTHYQAPTGSRIAIQYQQGEAPRIAVRMQEMYGQHDSPKVAGSVGVVVELLSPAGRPLQVTRDLAAFWQGSYRDVQKEMKGRYPKHYWPDDPAAAEATRKTKRAMGKQ
ncbi:ATP-dependent helicase HrpB [Corallincola platygyrae]